MITTKVRRIGNSLGITVPKLILKEMGWRAGTRVVLTMQRNKAVLIRKYTPPSEEILKQVQDDSE